MRQAVKLLGLALVGPCWLAAPAAPVALAGSALADFSGLYFQGGDGNYSEGNFDVGTTEHLDLLALYQFPNGFVLGAQYLYSISSGSSDASGGTSSYALKTTAYGPTIGWATPKGGLGVTATYLYNPTTVYTSTTTPTGGAPTASDSTLSGGTGYALDFAYHYPFGHWSVGPVISYQSFTYKKNVVNGTADTGYKSATEYLATPLFSVQYEFDQVL